VNTTPLQANLHPASQKQRRICFMLSPDLPAYLALIQRISRFHAWWSTALKMASERPPDIRTSGPYQTEDHRAMIHKKAARPSRPWSGNCGPKECSMTGQTAPGQAWGTPGGPAEPGLAPPNLPDRMARYGIWLAVITRILLHDRRFHATVITGVIGTYALASVIKNNQARPVRRAVAWYNVRGEVQGMKVLHRGRRALKPGKG
jgi:hypothetical protein